ncbi:cytochrome o ubiquinol oxidase subunit IV [Asticcacaulis solisilvae]|uniref:cytochrome o ubiquinol oxidase subunit IV n=1 Tax=Asticcacaulis solisilvae TaxID=1217274 RepID=UPI003FD798EB
MSSKTSNHVKPVATDQTHAELAHAHHEGGHGSVKSYLIGFALSVVLTAVPFALTMLHVLPVATLIPVIIGIGLVQIVVHLVYFLHMNTSPSHIWNNAAFVCALIIVFIVIVGTLWVMYHMNHNMMPGMMPID